MSLHDEGIAGPDAAKHLSPGSSTAAPVGPAVPYDRELAARLGAITAQLPIFRGLESIGPARSAKIDGMHEQSDDLLTRNGRLELIQKAVPGPAGAPDVVLLILRPVGAKRPMPAFYHIHGGGMIMGNARAIMKSQLDWAEEFGAAIISVEYRLAPETPHPGPVEDCYAGLRWTADHADELGIDAGRILIVGASAGGGLAAATTLLARDRGGPALAAQILVCPMLDDRLNSPSAIQEDGRGVWDRQSNLTGWTALLGDARGGPNVSPYAAPARMTDLSNLPPTFIDVGSAEQFRDESVAYASGIWRAGGDAELHVFAGGFHGYSSLAPDTTISRNTEQTQLAWVRRQMNDLVR